ncbi:hypothetical protein BDZ45DRAFT_144088 [Acephala macrosclerotiorum]|nr:hypothetical protein BDZ45DRAFT_144088 [Acephala macrosclerotiorum]
MREHPICVREAWNLACGLFQSCAKDIRHMKTEFSKKAGTEKEEAVDDMFEIMLKGFSKISILQHENRGLRNAIIMEQKKRKRGKRLDLKGEESSRMEAWSPSKVVKAVTY